MKDKTRENKTRDERKQTYGGVEKSRWFRHPKRYYFCYGYRERVQPIPETQSKTGKIFAKVARRFAIQTIRFASLYCFTISLRAGEFVVDATSGLY